jgi:hypothetical protein
MKALRKPSVPGVGTRMVVGEGFLAEQTLDGDQGTAFPFGEAVKYPCDAHRRDYTLADALIVAEFVSATGASWIDRVGR